MEAKKYKITNETIDLGGRILHRIECVTAFGDIKAGDKGGWIESENNLSQEGDAWVLHNAKIFGNAKVRGNAIVRGNAKVYGNAEVFGCACLFDTTMAFGYAKVLDEAWLMGRSKAYGHAEVRDKAELYGNAIVRDNTDYIVFKNNWSSGRYFTYTKSNKMWKVGCFYGTGEELIKKAYADSKDSGKHYEAYVRLVEKLEEIEKGIQNNSCDCGKII